MTFKNAVNNQTQVGNVAYTANGAVTNASSLNYVLDLFAIIGSLRGKNLNEYVELFDRAYETNRQLTLQMLLWLRDVRGGAGERGTFRTLMLHLEQKNRNDVAVLLPLLAEYGRWDDLLIFQTAHIQNKAYDIIAEALLAGNGLCAKWMPRVYRMKKGDNHTVANENRRANNRIAKALMTKLGMNDKKYRKLLSALSSTVETKMCAKKWNEIEYKGVPSVAMSRYIQAFQRNDEDRFEEFTKALVAGTTSVNASALFPYDLTRKVDCNGGDNRVLDAQWKALPNYLTEGAKVIPMCDTSSSMDVKAGDTTMSCKDVAMALSLYIADKQKGAFENLFLNFDDEPQIFELQGTTMSEKYTDLLYYRGGQYWGGSTDVGKAFEKILELAVDNSLPAEDMPETLIIFSDMEFNETRWDGRDVNNANWDMTAYEYAKKKFFDAGYALPNVVFWNLNGRPGNNPVTKHDTGTAMVSGFSTAVLKTILGDVEFDPISIMLETIDVPRYQVIK